MSWKRYSHSRKPSSQAAVEKRVTAFSVDDGGAAVPAAEVATFDSDFAYPLATQNKAKKTLPSHPFCRRCSKTMVIDTIFGHHDGQVLLCIQYSRLSTKPFFLLELSIATH
ncbi:hypothetical protein Tsubulata_025500 [Turnera subulata]|uniref:Uncharacterized protein n=1 Tax=Turnera subulata TaxID=218843 RepID=A0A9Q0FH90_9ROSI|nr:hypothetical protein Tsubulata_025500 [Turnera subulata]